MKTIVQNFGEAMKNIGRAVWGAPLPAQASMRGVALRRKATKNVEDSIRDADPRRFTAQRWMVMLIVVGMMLIVVNGVARRGGFDA